MTKKRSAATSASLFEAAGRQLAFSLDERRKAAKIAKEYDLGAAAPFLISAERYARQAERLTYRAMARERAEKRGKR